MGYDAVEIHVNDPKTLNIGKIETTCGNNSISVSTIGTGMGYTIDGLALPIQIQASALKLLRILEHVKVAKELNAIVIIGSMRGKCQMPMNTKYERYALDCFKTVMEYAEKHGVIITVEAINRYETNFINNVRQGLEFIESEQ